MIVNSNQKEEDKKSRDLLQSLFREQQMKFIYFIISLCVSSIGFTIYTTLGKVFFWYNSFVFLAIIFWGLSIYFALKFIIESLNIIYLNIDWYETLLDNKDLPKSLTKKETLEILKEVLLERSLKTQKKFKLMTYFFYFGVILFLVFYSINILMN